MSVSETNKKAETVRQKQRQRETETDTNTEIETDGRTNRQADTQAYTRVRAHIHIITHELISADLRNIVKREKAKTDRRTNRQTETERQMWRTEEESRTQRRNTKKETKAVITFTPDSRQKHNLRIVTSAAEFTNLGWQDSQPTTTKPSQIELYNSHHRS